MGIRLLLGLLLGLLWGSLGYAEPDRVAIETIILEAGNQSLEGQIAVGEVIRNRAKRGDLSHDSVCLADHQFSCWNPGKQARNAKKALGRVSGPTWQRASRAWAESEHSNLTQGATHYLNPRLAAPKWAKVIPKTVTIGQHQFHKEG